MIPERINPYPAGDPGKVDPSSLNQIIAALNALNREVQAMKGEAVEPPRLVTTYLFKPTAAAVRGGVYTGTLWDTSDLGDFDTVEAETFDEAALGEAGRGAVGIHLSEMGGTAHQLGDGSGRIFPAVLRGVNADGAVVVTFGDDAPGTLFPVAVAQAGGSAGNQTTACTFTYDVTNLAGTSVATGAGPAWARPVGKMVAGTIGTAYYDAAGAFVLLQVDEVPDTAAC